MSYRRRPISEEAAAQLIRAIEPALEAQSLEMEERERRRAEAIDHAFEDVPDPAKTELAQLSEDTRKDLRLELLKNLQIEDREIFASVLTMQSSERTGTRLLIASWALVATTIGLVLNTVALVAATLANH